MERTRRFSFDAKLARHSSWVVALFVITACQAESAKPNVTYLGGPALGPWLSTAGEGGQAGAAGAAPQGGVGAPEAGAGGGAGMSATGPSSLAFDVLTHSQGGKYSPKNIGAIWIETSGGDFVKTLEVWAQRRAGHLTRWKNETGSNRVDAVSSATLRSHVVHNVTWDLSDVSGNAVEPGDYKLVIEATDRDSTGASQEIPFTLGTEPQVITPPDASAFSSMSLTLE